MAKDDNLRWHIYTYSIFTVVTRVGLAKLGTGRFFGEPVFVSYDRNSSSSFKIYYKLSNIK